MSVLSEVIGIGPDQALALEARAKSGDLEAAKLFAKYAVWRKLLRDSYIPYRWKIRLYRAIVTTIKFTARLSTDGR